MAVPVAIDATFSYDEPQEVFNGRYYHYGLGRNFDVGLDGRFLMIKEELGQADEVVLILNWIEELKRLVPVP